MSSFIKIRPVVPEMFHADGRKDMTKLIVPFLNFVKAPKKLPLTGIYKCKSRVTNV
jgi:PhoPQ-activated pathogenicity-related protein